MLFARRLAGLVPSLGLALTLASAPCAASGEAPQVVIKLGTLAPAGSLWERVLVEMGQRWKEASGGLVKLQVYAGGVAGDEADLVRGMGIGKQHAAMITVAGLANITRGPMATCVPQLVTSDDELDHVVARLAPTYEKELAQAGYTVLSWSDAGWLRFFSTKPFTSPEGLKPLKFFVWTGETGSVEIWKDRGYRPVPLAAPDITLSMQSGLIDVVPMTALTALSMQSYLVAKYVLDVPWSPLLGATIVRTEAWQRIPAEMRPKLMEIAAEMGAKLRADVRRLDAEALDSMAEKGLVVQHATPAERAAWTALAESAHPRIRTEVVDPASFDAVKAARDEYRASRAGAARPAAAGSSSPPTR
jgi:TRAP-type C4-dicarboxylate transport system substrate-binding protein